MKSENGWNVLIETTNGNVGLWTCWLGNRFSLFYPLDVEIPDKVIMDTLNVTLAKPVKSIVNKDLKKFETKLWAKFYSERLEEGGRVWIDKTNSDFYDIETLYTISGKKPVNHYFGYERSNTIYTISSPPSNFFTNFSIEPDAPNSSQVNSYRDKFIELLIKVAKLTGDIKAINFDSSCRVLYTPENFTMLWKDYDYNEILEEMLFQKKYYYTKNGNNEIVLYQCNPFAPWKTILRGSITNDELTVERLINFINSYDEMEDDYNIAKLFSSLCDNS